MNSIYFSPNFAPALQPAFVAILEAFTTLEYRKALNACHDFYGELIRLKHQLGEQYQCTVTSFCAVRTLLHYEMGFYTFPEDLPSPEPPHLQPLPDLAAPVPSEVVAFRLISALFECPSSGAFAWQALGWTPDRYDAMLRSNAEFFGNYALQHVSGLRGKRGIPDVEVSRSPPSHAAMTVVDIFR
jgi:hypothetical protein